MLSFEFSVNTCLAVSSLQEILLLWYQQFKMKASSPWCCVDRCQFVGFETDPIVCVKILHFEIFLHIVVLMLWKVVKTISVNEGIHRVPCCVATHQLVQGDDVCDFIST